MPPGLSLEPGKASFRLFCPRAVSVRLFLYRAYRHGRPDEVFLMEAAGGGWWTFTLFGEYRGWYYGYRINSATDVLPGQPLTEHAIADPYARLWAVENSYLQKPLSLIGSPPPFDWENDTYLAPVDPRDLIIYECHIKDLIAHPSSGSRYGELSAYRAFANRDQRGGIAHLKRLGVNAVEFLPLQHFAYFEPPFLEATTDGVLNTWNYYGRNYWGYMPTSYFVPHLLYASGADPVTPGAIADNANQAVNELKQLVKTLHRAGIAVIVDVVYNHLSQYDLNPLKYADNNYYLRKNAAGYFTSDSGCGNDFRTEAPEARRMVLESLKYWLTEFHVDGFRFDLAKIIDWGTIESIRDELKSINPYVMLIAEPWGGGYDPQGFSLREWSAWNDQLRNGVKGSDPVRDRGFIFGGWHHSTTRFALENYLAGTLAGRDGGRFYSSKHAINYLESHDNHTLADFIRIGLDATKASTPVQDAETQNRLSLSELKLSKLAALYLFCAQGTVMLHAGQEAGRSKRVAASPEHDPATGLIDHNSYEKDNATNWLDFRVFDWNAELFAFYTGLIRIRREAPALRRSSPGSLRFVPSADPLQLEARISGAETGDRFDYRIFLNGNTGNPMPATDLTGWELLVSPDFTFPDGTALPAGFAAVPPSSGMLLRRERKLGN